jgi:hypothetical protein
MQIKCIFERSKGDKNINPTISKKEFERLGFRQYHYHPNIKDGGTWSVYYTLNVNPKNQFDILDVKWFCGTERYEIHRDTERVRHIPVFSGYLRNKRDLELILSLADLTIFYDCDEEMEVKL